MAGAGLPEVMDSHQAIEHLLYRLEIEGVEGHGELLSRLRGEFHKWRQGEQEVQRGREELQRVQESLRRREQIFRSVFEHHIEAVFQTDETGHFTALNQAAERLCGYTSEEAAKLTVAELCAPECRQAAVECFEKAKAGDARELETTIVCKDGTRVDIWVGGGPIMVDGKLEGIFAVAKDITARKRAEAEVRKSRDRLALALEIAQAGLVSWNIRKNEATWNEFAYRIHGYEPGAFEPTMEFWLNSLYGEDRERIQRQITTCIWDKRQEIAVEYRIKRPTGEVRWVRGLGRFFFDAQGQPDSFTGIALDITRQRRNQERFTFIAEASKLFATSLDTQEILTQLTRLTIPALADFCVIYQMDGPEQFHMVARAHVNPAHEATLDRIGQRFINVPTHPQSRIVAAIRTCQPQMICNASIDDCRHATDDPELLGLWTYLQCRSCIILPLCARREVLGILFLFMTESERNYTPEDLSLAEETGVRAGMALIHARLFQEAQAARAQAESANRAKDDFLAVLSHELRTPLAPVFTAVQMLEKDPAASPEQRQWAELMHRNIGLEARLIDDLLDVTRITRGKIEIHMDALDLHRQLQHVVETCRPDLDQRYVQLHWDLQASHFIVNGDAARLQQVFLNILNNALKFTPDEGSITIATRNQIVAPANPADSGEEVVVSVTDTGMGIAPEILPRIFNAFEQGGPHTTRRYGGLGLGLAISKGLIERHGGTITAASPGINQGATFRIHLPALPRTVPGDSLPQVPSGPPVPLRILLVEDHPDTAAVFAKLLRSHGHQVHVSHSIQCALLTSARERFDVLISDIGLPDGSGLELPARLPQKLPAIALSGFGMEEDVRRSREAGFAFHLTKPVDMRLLQQTLGRLLVNSSRQDNTNA